MRSLLQTNRLFIALAANAVLLLLILLAVTARDSRGFTGAAAFGQTPPGGIALPQPPVSVMPCQLSANTWGCYVMDPQNQTLTVYQYLPHEELRLLAARDLQYDRRLKLFNTSPAPVDIKSMLERSDEPGRAAPTTMRSPELRYR